MTDQPTHPRPASCPVDDDGATAPTLRDGDVIRYTPARRIGDNVYWCREGTALVGDYGGILIAYDTYWSTTDGQDRLTDAELATAEVLFNLADYDMVPHEWRWEQFAPADRQVVTAQHGLQKRYYVRKGAGEDLATQIENAQQRVARAESDVRSAENSLAWERKQLAELEAKRGELSVDDATAVSQ